MPAAVANTTHELPRLAANAPPVWEFELPVPWLPAPVLIAVTFSKKLFHAAMVADGNVYVD